MEIGWLLFPPLEPNILSVYNLDFPLQIRNREQIESLLETTTIPNLDQAAPNIGNNLPLIESFINSLTNNRNY